MSFSIDDAQVQDFLSFLQLKNLSAQATAQYQWLLKDLFHSLLPSLAAVRDIDASQLRGYVAALQAMKLAEKTVGDRVTILKCFFGYLASEGRLPTDPSGCRCRKSGNDCPKP